MQALLQLVVAHVFKGIERNWTIPVSGRLAFSGRVRITLTSNEFDPFIYLGQMTDGVFTGELSDDDGLSDTHAKLEWKAPADGTYEIRAGSFAQGQTGSYALTVEKKP